MEKGAEVGTKDNFIPAEKGSIIGRVGELEKGAELGTKDNFIPAVEVSIIRRVGELEKGAEVGTKDNFFQQGRDQSSESWGAIERSRDGHQG